MTEKCALNRCENPAAGSIEDDEGSLFRSRVALELENPRSGWAFGCLDQCRWNDPFDQELAGAEYPRVAPQET